MGFLDTVRQLLTFRGARDAAQARRLAAAWGLDESEESEPPAREPVNEEAGRIVGATSYDRKIWERKLVHLVTEKLPVPQEEWDDFLADAVALGFTPGWIEDQKRRAYTELAKRIVADGVITAAEHHQLDLARVQLELNEAEASKLIKLVIDEAERHLGHDVSGA